MKRNMSDVDRIARLAVGIVAVVLAWIAGWTSVVGIVLMVLAAILVLTAAFAFCPLYAVLRLNTSAKA